MLLAQTLVNGSRHQLVLVKHFVELCLSRLSEVVHDNFRELTRVFYVENRNLVVNIAKQKLKKHDCR